MFPSHATMYLSAISFEDDRESKIKEYSSSMNDWDKFSVEMDRFYNIDMSSLSVPYQKEQEDYFIYSGLWTELRIEHTIGQPVIIKQLDLNTCTLEDSECVNEVNFNIAVPFPVRLLIIIIVTIYLLIIILLLITGFLDSLVGLV